MKNTNSLCAVVAGATMIEVIAKIKKAKNMAGYVEVRSDYLNNQSDIDLELIKRVGIQNIITCRRSDEGGKWKGSETKRLHVLQQAYKHGFFVDIELKTLAKEKIVLTSQMQKKTIVSYHNFDETPSLDELRNIITQMKMYKPLIKKIAVMVNKEIDKQTLYGLLINAHPHDNLCVVGMGKLGRQVRILSPLLGGKMTYCSVNPKDITAPGQMTCGEMINIYKTLY
jgi:3-dehydroquinate dehydratase type I